MENIYTGFQMCWSHQVTLGPLPYYYPNYCYYGAAPFMPWQPQQPVEALTAPSTTPAASRTPSWADSARALSKKARLKGTVTAAVGLEASSDNPGYGQEESPAPLQVQG
eukprot:GEMP01099625.1.p2 GENE.GEMP01099625.1~~GEMP01099625.1.p2  ORF type:complete len:109 (+),score=20.67 GEMP01099625.1:201-527(+)